MPSANAVPEAKQNNSSPKVRATELSGTSVIFELLRDMHPRIDNNEPQFS